MQGSNGGETERESGVWSGERKDGRVRVERGGDSREDHWWGRVENGREDVRGRVEREWDS